MTASRGCIDGALLGGPVPGFDHPFNLMVEFVYPDGDGANKENAIPIPIDPDIRHPGGSGE